jgi:hypothetical protein
MLKMTFKKTNKKKKVNGYSARKFVLKGTVQVSMATAPAQDKQGKLIIWMTRALHIHWGMLADLWHQNPLKIPSEHKFAQLIFNKGYFPVKLTAYIKGKKLGGVDIKATKMKIDSSKVQLPASVKLVSLSKYFSKILKRDSTMH